MLPIFTLVGTFLVLLPVAFLAARDSKDEQKMRRRFAMLQVGGAGGLSGGKQSELLKRTEQEAPLQNATVSRVAEWMQLDRLILQAHSLQSPLQFLRLSVCLLAGAGLMAAFASRSVAVGALVGLGSASIPWLHLKRRSRLRLTAMNKVLPQVLDMMARSLRAGHSLPAVLGILAEEAAEPAKTAFGDVFQKQRLGLPLRDALMELILQFPSEDLKVLVTAILVQKDTGGNLVQILERTSTVIRERLKLQGEVRVHTAQGRMTGWILCLLPVLLLGMLMVTNPAYPRPLFQDPLGRKLAYGGVALLAVGMALIQGIVKGIEV